jgi:CBS domain-containing protein
MLSEVDLLETRVHSDGDERWWKIPVHFAMHPAETADIDDDVDTVATRMGATKVGAFAVLEHDKLAGVISVVDVLLAQGANQRAPA